MKGLIEQYNALGAQRKTLIQKALTTQTNSGEALIPEKLEKIITNTVVRLSPEMAVIQPEFDNQKLHSFNRLMKLPRAGGFMGEGATTPTSQGSYERASVELKILRRKGAVTNFLQDTSKKYIDASTAEMENHLQAHVYDIINALKFGNAESNKFSFDGLDKIIKTNRVNEARGGVVPTDLSFLDDMIDANIRKNGAGHNKVLMMSPEMQSLVSRLLTNVRLMQGNAGTLGHVEINGGWRLATYRDIPILPVADMGGNKVAIGTVSLDATGSGSISAGNYFFQVSAITLDGETIASEEVTNTISANKSAKLQWTAVENASYYKIYCSKTTGTEKLVAVIPACTYDGTGTYVSEVTGVEFTTDPSVKNPTLKLIATGSFVDPNITASVTDAMANDVPIVATGGVAPETVMLWDLDKYQGLGKVPYTNVGGDKFGGLVTMTPLAITDDNIPFMVKSYLALCDAFEATSFMHRGLRTK